MPTPPFARVTSIALICCVGIALTSALQRPLPVFVYVDPVDYERALLLDACAARGAEALQVWSEPYAHMICEKMGLDKEEARAVMENSAPPRGSEISWATSRLSSSHRVVGVLCGSDAGLATAERLQEVLLPARSNGIVAARRDKWLMNEMVAAAGLNTAAHASVASWEEAKQFLERLPLPLAAVVKPRRGQSSLRVGLASSLPQARRMVEALLRTPTSLDHSEVPAGCALLQEYVEGDEWVVDTVSRDGEHKALALWRYKKGAANGAPFVYSYDELMAADGNRERSLLQYAFDVLDALDWRWGPTHMELKWTSRGPVLIEVNAGRFNGVDFKLLVDLCIGYNMYDAAIAAFIDDEAWQSLPKIPPRELRAAGRLVKLISTVEGRLVKLRHVEEIELLPSVISLEPAYSTPGECVQLTVDLSSVAGFATLIHNEPAVVEEDCDRIHELQRTMFQVVDDDDE